MIKDLRKEMGWTQLSFARFLSVSPGTLSLAENGKISLPKEQQTKIRLLKQQLDDEVMGIIKPFNENEVYEREKKIRILLNRRISSYESKSNRLIKKLAEMQEKYLDYLKRYNINFENIPDLMILHSNPAAEGYSRAMVKRLLRIQVCGPKNQQKIKEEIYNISLIIEELKLARKEVNLATAA